MKTSSAYPWFIDATDRLIEEFYDQFESELHETLFVIMTEQVGNQQRTLCEAAEQINCAMHGRDLFKLMDDEYEDLPYDEFFMQNSDLCQEVMTKMLKKFSEKF